MTQTHHGSPSDESFTAATEAPHEESRPIVRVDGLMKRFGDTLAVRDVSFEIEEGEIFGFIGPNGAGKTTTLRILATLLEPTEGDVWIDGLRLDEHTEAIRSVIGYMPDYFGVYEGITVYEYLEFFAAAYKLPIGSRPSVLEGVLELTDLGGLRTRMVSSLSRGMKQRLCLAKTLVHDPKVLLLDEPAASLDPRARIELRALLKELGRMGKTILISSHILTELSDLCDSVGIIERGKLVESGNVSLLERKRWGGDKVRIHLHGPCPEVAALLEAQADVRDVRVDHDKAYFEYLGEPADFHRVIKRLVDHEVPLLAVQHDTRNLEDLFMELTKGDVQ